MTMEIKQGDKVRVSKDVPRMYVRWWCDIAENSDCKVNYVEDDNAVITNGPHIIAIPTKYLIKDDAEEIEPKFQYQVGQKVILDFYGGEVSTITEAFNDGGGWNKYKVKALPHHIWNEYELTPYTEPTAPKIKVGDSVEELVSRKIGRVLGIDGDFVVVGIPYDREKHYWHINSVELVSPSNPAEEKPNVGSIKIPVEVDLADSYWDAYTAALAKEIVLKTVNTASDKRPEKVAEYAVLVAKAVVEGLKNK